MVALELPVKPIHKTMLDHYEDMLKSCVAKEKYVRNLANQLKELGYSKEVAETYDKIIGGRE